MHLGYKKKIINIIFFYLLLFLNSKIVLPSELRSCGNTIYFFKVLKFKEKNLKRVRAKNNRNLK